MNTNITERPSPVADETVLLALASEQRRAILRSLGESTGDELSMEAVVDEVTASIRGRTAGTERRRRARIGLNHVHLPKLDDAGLVEWDRKQDVVRAGPAFDAGTTILRTWADTIEGGPPD